MMLSRLNAALAMMPPQQSGAQGGAPAWVNFVPLSLLLVVFYFALIRPQQKKAKEHTEMLKAIRPGDKIITSGGVVAVVVTVKDKTLNIRSGDAKFEITKSAIAEITERGGEPSES